MDTNALLIGKAITRSHAIDKLLRKHYPVAKGSLHATLNSLADALPAILIRAIRVVANVRNAAAHPDEFKSATVPPDFDRLCNEIELLIPYFADQQLTQPAQSPKKTAAPATDSLEGTASCPAQPAKKNLPPASKPQPTAATLKSWASSVAPNNPTNYGKSWTPEEDRMLADAFDAQTTIPELAKAHQRGVGGIQNRLVKLGRLTADQYKTYSSDSQ
jgi:hypothetical protein